MEYLACVLAHSNPNPQDVNPGINGHAKIIIPIHFRIMNFLGNLKGWTFARRMPRNRHHCWHYLLAMFVFDSPIAVAVAVAAAINVN